MTDVQDSPHQAAPEARIRELGEEILERARRAEPSVIRPDWWMGRLLDWATADPRRRTQLFRFVDVLPTLTAEQDLLRHLEEYLLADGVPLPRPFRALLHHAANGAWYRSEVAAITRSSALRMAGRFIAGQTIEEAIATVMTLRQQNMGVTLDILGEATQSEQQAQWYMQQCVNLIQALAKSAAAWPVVENVDRSAYGPVPRVNLSLKLSSLTPLFDPIAPQRTTAAVAERLRPILRLARSVGAFVNVDMEQYQYKDLTFAIFQQVLNEPEFRDVSNVGIVLQAYLKDAATDLDRLIEWVHRRGTPISLRLVKGAYWDYEMVTAIQQGWLLPVWAEKWRTDTQYESLARKLLDHRHLLRPAIASHNVRSLAATLAYADSRNISPQEFELQMLFGMGDPLKQAVVQMGYPLRVYAPFGELIPGMAYLIRRLLENTSNESFLKHTFSEHQSIDQLLADPSVAQPPSSPLPAPVRVDPEEDVDMLQFAAEPLTDFSQTESRAAMQKAIDALPRAFGTVHPLVIAGQRIMTDPPRVSINPSLTTQTIGCVCFAEPDHVDQAVAAAKKAFDEHWSQTTASDRGELLRKTADLLRKRRFELAAWIVYEAGKPWREADGDVAEAIDFCNFYAEAMERLEARPRLRHFPGQRNDYIYQPRGVVAVIAPWNFPLAILTGMTSAALAAGNCVIMKPAEQTSIIAAKLMDILEEAGFPPGVVNFLPGNGETIGAALVQHPAVNVIAFTGSRDVGVKIYELASRWQPGQQGLKRTIAEMGGKNAIIIDADADLDDAVAGVLASAFGYAGQKCSACSRVIVLSSIQSTFVDRLVEAAKAVPTGPATAPETVIGPVIDEPSLAKVLRYIELGKAEGRLVFQGELGSLVEQGTFVAPAIFSDLATTARIAQEEIFGPVIAVIAAADFDEALHIANSTDYALTGGVYSRSPAHLAAARRRFQVGNLYINQKITGAIVDRQPFGGFKMSGVGSKAGGPDYLLQFLEPRTITENTLRHGFASDSLPTA